MDDEYQKAKLIISKVITRDLFASGKAGDKLYNKWKKNPIAKIRYLDSISKKVNFKNFGSSASSRSVMLKILLRLRNENKMEQVKEVIEKGEGTEKIKLPQTLSEEMALKGHALAEEDVCRQELIKQAKNKGWLGVTVDELDMEMSSVFRKMANQVRKIEDFDGDDMKVISQMRGIRNDKVDLMKFNIATNLKIKEIESRNKDYNPMAAKKPGETIKSEVILQ